MDIKPLFQTALGLTPPWIVTSVVFKAGESEGRGRLDIALSFPAGSRFPCPECAAACPVHDTHEQTWRHLDFFQHQAFLTARVPRTQCEAHGVRTVCVPWARDGSGFTLLFEAFLLLMAPEMPVAALARTVGEHDTRLWRVLQWHTLDARERVEMKEVRDLVVDETSRARGHDYVTLFVEPGVEKSRVLFVADGRRHDVFAHFVADLKAHAGDPERIRNVCMDMSEPFQKGATEQLPAAEVTFDHFHVVKLVGEAVDEVRRLERFEQPTLRDSRYVWLKNPENMTGSQFEIFSRLSQLNLRTTKAYQMRLNIQEVWKQPDAKAAGRVLRKWCTWVLRVARPGKGQTKSGFEPMAKAARTIREKTRGILNYFRRRLTGGVIEGLNSYVQAARARARGYRNPETFKTMIYLIAGRLQFNLPALTH